MHKTNAMRILDRAKLPYAALSYPADPDDLSGGHVAELLGRPAGQVFKTLVLKGERVPYLVCCLPSDREIDLKKAAAACGEKRLAMIAVKDLQPVTGYIRGGCSPLGMKKSLPTYVAREALDWAEIVVSAGLRGLQIALAPDDLLAACGGTYADLTRVD